MSGRTKLLCSLRAFHLEGSHDYLSHPRNITYMCGICIFVVCTILPSFSFPFYSFTILFFYRSILLLHSCTFVLTYLMSRLIDLRRASEAATVRKPSTLVKPLAPGTTKTTLPPFREILPAYHPVARSPPSLSPSRSPEPPLQEYYLPHKRGKDDVIMIPYTMHKPDNEAIHSTTRKTASGKTLTYTLNVKQQPERARACGAGARGELSYIACNCERVLT